MAPPIIIEYISLSNLSDISETYINITTTDPINKVTKLYIIVDSVLKKPKPIPIFQIKSKFKKSFK